MINKRHGMPFYWKFRGFWRFPFWDIMRLGWWTPENWRLEVSLFHDLDVLPHQKGGQRQADGFLPNTSQRVLELLGIFDDTYGILPDVFYLYIYNSFPIFPPFLKSIRRTSTMLQGKGLRRCKLELHGTSSIWDLIHWLCWLCIYLYTHYCNFHFHTCTTVKNNSQDMLHEAGYGDWRSDAVAAAAAGDDICTSMPLGQRQRPKRSACGRWELGGTTGARNGKFQTGHSTSIVWWVWCA